MEAIDRYDSLIGWYCEKHGFPFASRVKAQLLAESSMQPKAVSEAGAKGLAQAMPATWREWMGDEDPFNPEASIEFCVRYMKWLYERFRDVQDPDERYRFALAAYHAGIGNIQKLLARVPPAARDHWELAARHLDEVTGRHAPLTRHYVSLVMARAKRWEERLDAVGGVVGSTASAAMAADLAADAPPRSKGG